jgi:hypothetical protein
MVRLVLRLFVTVTDWAAVDVPTAWFPKLRYVGTAVACDRPVPVKDAVCGLLLAPSVTVSVPDRFPVVDGVKVTLIVHDLPAASELPQLFVCE